MNIDEKFNELTSKVQSLVDILAFADVSATSTDTFCGVDKEALLTLGIELQKLLDN